MSEALAKYRALIEQHPNNELARFSLGKAYYDAGQFAEAKEQLEKAIAKKPNWMVVQILIGKCEHSLGNPPAARSAFERGLQLAIEQNHDGPRAEMEQLLAEID